MKYVTLSLLELPSNRHPMHQFLVDTDGYESTQLVGSTVSDGVHTALFHVDGWPPGPYEDALDDVETIRQYVISQQSDQTFSVYVQEELREHDREITEAFGRVGLITLLPVVYDTDGTVHLTLVGPASVLQTALEDMPPEATVDIRDIGSYNARRIGGTRDLTDRQIEAVVAAVEEGYYEDPRAASVADIGETVGCAPATAAEHLRRAERTVMRAYVADALSPNQTE